MGHKASRQSNEPKSPLSSASTLDDEKVETPSPDSSRNFRASYLKRIGLGADGDRNHRNSSITAADFKVPKWLEAYTPPQNDLDTSTRDSIDVENIASNETYNLSFIHPKTNDQIRRNLLQRMSNYGLWVPPSQRPKGSQSIIIFDWDDTLLCTSFLHTREDAMNITSKVIKAQLQELEDSVTRLLKMSQTMGSSYIITNAMKGWVEYSSSIWMPGLSSLLQSMDITSARFEYEKKYPDNYHQWKVEAFLEMTNHFDTETVTNLIVLGDSMVEIDAANILGKRYTNACIKTIKFRENPSPEELVKQLDLVTDKFTDIVSSVKNMTIRLERKGMGKE